MRHWTPAERLRQAQLIRQWQPWKNAGVKTAAGKAISKMNAHKHGMRSAEIQSISRTITLYRKFLKHFN